MRCVNLIRCPTQCYLMPTLENYYATGCKRKRWRTVKLIETISESTRRSKVKRNPINQHFLGKSTLRTGNEFLKFTFEVEIISLYTLSPSLPVWYIDRWKLLATHNLSYGFIMFKQKGIFFSVIFIARNTGHRLGSNGSRLLKKMRDYKDMILMRKPVVSKHRNLVWRWDWK